MATQKYRNTGAAFTRSENDVPERFQGQVIHRGVAFVPSAKELKRKAYKLTPVGTVTRPTDHPEVEVEAEDVEDAAEAPSTGEAAEDTAETDEGDEGTDEGDEIDDLDVSVYRTGGSWYELPNGEKVQGEAAAEARLRELAGEGD